MAHGMTACVPVDAPRTELLAHVRRVQRLTGEVMAAASTPDGNVISLTGETDTSQLSVLPHVSTKKVAIITVGVMLSQAVDLHAGNPETDDIYWTEYMDLDAMAGAGGPAVVRARAAMEAAAQVSAHVGGTYTVSYVDPGVPDDLYSTDRTSILRSLRTGGKTE